MDLIERDCPICGASAYSLRGEGGRYLYVREFLDTYICPAPAAAECYSCKFVFLNPVMTDEEYQKFYNNDEQKKFVASVANETETKYQTKISRDDTNRSKLVKSYTDANGKLLDVGTGFSNFVGLIDGAVGIDISEPRVRSAKERGLDVRLCDISDWDEPVDTVTLFHVLEHIPAPAPFLERVHEVLNERGQLIVEVPNLDDALVGLESYKDFYFQNAHCSYFTPATLTTLLHNVGFEVVAQRRLQRYSFDNHMHWLFKKRPGKFKLLGFLNKIYSSVLKALKLHDTIFLVCKKR